MDRQRIKRMRGRVLTVLAAAGIVAAFTAAGLVSAGDDSDVGVLQPVLGAGVIDSISAGVELTDEGTLLVALKGTGQDDGQVLEGVDANEDGVFSGDEFSVIAEGLPSIELVFEKGEDPPEPPAIAGPNEAIRVGDRLFVTIGSEVGEEISSIIEVHEDGSYTTVADLLAYEEANNTDGYIFDFDGEEFPDLASNAFSMVPVEVPVEAGEGGETETHLIVSDSSANALLIVNPNTGVIDPEPYFVFPTFDSGLGFPSQSVPTGLEWGPDGGLYATILTGFPFPEGGAKVYRFEDLDGDGDAVEEGEAIVVAGNLTLAMDVVFDDAGRMIVSELSLDLEQAIPLPGRVSRSLFTFNEGDPLPGTGGVEANMVWLELAVEPFMPWGLAYTGDLYVSESFKQALTGGPFAGELSMLEGPLLGFITVFEGWNEIPSWPGDLLEDDGIAGFFDLALEDWLAVAHYDGEEWLQLFKNAPLPGFNTLTVVEPGNTYWVFTAEPCHLIIDIPPPQG